MRRHPDGLLRVAGAGGAGVIWGLGLARLVAEAGLCATLYGSPLAVTGVAVGCAAVAIATLRRCSFQPSQGFLIPLVLPLLYVFGLVPHPLAGGVLLAGGVVLALLMAWGDRMRWLPPAVLGLVTLGLYLRTLLPSVGQADTFEFQVVVPKLGVAHPTGYPLYILVGKLFTLLPLGNVAWRVNVASATFGTGAVLVLYFLLLRLTARRAQGVSRWWPAFLAALAFAFSFTFWSQAVVAEVYTLHSLLVVIILWLLLSGSACSVEGGGGRGEGARRWQVVCFLLGLSLTNHLTTALLLPAVAVALVWDRPRLRARDWLIGGGLGLLGLSVYLFIPLRWPALNRGEWMTVGEFVSYVTGGQFHGALRLDGWRDPVRWGIVGRLLREPFGWVGLGLAAVGVVGLAARQRRALALTGVTFLAFVVYGLDYYVPDISVFLLPAHLVLAVWMGAGIGFLAGKPCEGLGSGSDTAVPRSSEESLVCRVARNLRKVGGVHCSLFIVHCSLFLLPLSRVWVNLPVVDQSQNQGGYAWGQYVLSLPLEAGSAVLADPEKFAPLYYLQQIEGVRPDLDLMVLGSEELYQAELAARLGTGQMVYLARYLPNLGGLYLQSVGPLVEVRNPVFDKNRVSEEGGTRFGEAIWLLDAEVSADPLGRAMVHVRLHWEAETGISDDLIVRLRLVDADNQTRWKGEGTRPVGGLYPTNAWPAGVAVSDYHEVWLPPWLPPGTYQLEVGLFPRFGDAGLVVDGGATAWLALDTVVVTSPRGPVPALPHTRFGSFTGGAWLAGYDVGSEVPAGAPFVVDLSWQGVETAGEVRLAWVDADGREVETATFPLAAGAVRSHHVMNAPQGPGDYTLHVGLVGEAARCSWLASPSGGCALAPVAVTPAQEGLANFAERVLLLEAAVSGGDDASVAPGGTVSVALRWRALRAMAEDYTAFVHLVGPDGRLHGQVDAWPVQGTLPTSRWAPGEELDDPYEVRLDPDAPAGHYRVEVGWYLLATMQRLQVVDVGGQAVGDAFVVGEFDVGD